MKKNILDVLKDTVIVGDGAMGSELMKRGLVPGECPELWNTEHPDRVQEVHRSYIEAGSRFLLTNTFGGNELKLDKAGCADRMKELNRAGVELLKETLNGPDIYIAGDIGPTGEFLQPAGGYTPEDFREIFGAQAEALAEAGADCIIIETMADLNELRAAVLGAKQVCTLPVAASMTFEKGAAGFRTMMGAGVEDFIAVCEECDVDIVGTNCGKGAHETADVFRSIHESCRRPVLAFPNAGVPRIEEGQTVYDQSPEIMEPLIRDIVNGGVAVIGGCCGTDCSHIEMIARTVRDLT